MSNESDDALMEGARSGDASAFKTLYDRHHGRVFAYLSRMVADRAAAADVVQEAFVRLWKARETWEPGGSVAGYLIRTCRRLVVDEQRRKKVRDRWARRTASAPSPSAPAPDVELEQRELAARLASEIEALPERMREVFSLKRDAGLTYREIAEVLGISPKTVDAHMTRALTRLRERLGDLR